MMTAPDSTTDAQPSIDQLDQRQDEVLRQLDDLNDQVLALLEEMSQRLTTPAGQPPDPTDG